MRRTRLTIDKFKQSQIDGNTIEAPLLTKAFSAQIKAEGAPEDQLRTFIISTSGEDREHDVINANGWRLDNYRKNSVVLWAHDYRLPPIASAKRVWLENNALHASAQFTPADMNHPLGYGFGHTIMRMYDEGFLHAVSVGFDPIKWTWNEERSGQAIDFEEQELLEFSAVPIPANPEALIQASKKGIDIRPIYDWTEYALDCGESLCVPRSAIEATNKQLAPQFGSQLKGKRIEIDAGEAVSLIDKLKSLFGASTKKNASSKEDQIMEEKLDKLIETVAGLVELCKAQDDQIKSLNEKIKEPEPIEPEPELTLDDETKEAVLDLVSKTLDEKLCQITGELD